MKMRIAIDANGGDYAPEEIVMGAIMAAREYDKDTQLVQRLIIPNLRSLMPPILLR